MKSEAVEIEGRCNRPTGLSNEGKIAYVAQELMWDQELDPRDILVVVEGVYGQERARGRLYDILLSAFHRSFRSEIPFITASIYFRNVSKVYPQIGIDLSKTAIRMFKNMIMERGTTGVVIRSEPEYRIVQQAYYDAFRIYPPRTANVFETLIRDRNCMQKLYDNPIFFKRIVEIFSFVEPRGVEELRVRLVAQYQQELEALDGAGVTYDDAAGILGRIDEIRQRMIVIGEITRYP